MTGRSIGLIASTGNWNYSVVENGVTKYYRIDVPTYRLGQSENISYTTGTSSDYDFKVTLPTKGDWSNPDVRYYKYSSVNQNKDNWGTSGKTTFTDGTSSDRDTITVRL